MLHEQPFLAVVQTVPGEECRRAESGADAESFEEAREPAQVGERIVSGVIQMDVSTDLIPQLTNAMHWGYGTMLGGLYGLIQGTARARPVLLGPPSAGWCGCSDARNSPRWDLLSRPGRAPAPKNVAVDAGIRLLYGLAVAEAYEAIDRRT